jgi:hypothetical protein
MRHSKVIRSLIVFPSGILTGTESCVLPWQFVLVYQGGVFVRIYLETDSFHPDQLDGCKILLNITLTQEGYQD